MDLRHLRNHPESELTQFKQRLKSFMPPPYIIVILVIIILVGLVFAVLAFHKSNQMKKEPIKVYKPVHSPQQKASEKVPADRSTVEITDSNSIFGAQTDALPVENTPSEDFSDTDFETPEATAQSVSEYSEPSEPNSDQQKDDTNEEARKLAEHLKVKKAEINQMLREAEQLSSQAQNTLNQAAPILVNHLNSLSSQEQSEFLNQVRTQMLSQFPPEVRELFDKNPDLEKKAWQNFLDLLQSRGFDPPD